MNQLQRIRDLAKETMQYAQSEEMHGRRRLWRAHNSLQFTRPLVYVRAIPFDEFLEKDALVCEDAYLRDIERTLLLNRYRMRVADDYIIEPYLCVRAAVAVCQEGVYGVPDGLGHKPMPGGAAAYRPAIVAPEDVSKLRVLDYAVDEHETRARVERLSDVLDGALDVAVDRQGALCTMWNNDISTVLCRLRGLEQVMWDVYDNPEWLHGLLGFMRDSILKHIDQTQAAGGFRLVNHQNQAMPYACELAPPSADARAVGTKALWGYAASQEFTGVGGAQFEQFMLDYQRPILERYGLSAYGCCEDLTHKIDALRKIPNLRRIAVSPFANVRRCAEQIGGDYVLSWRPHPDTAVSRGVNADFVRKEMREAFAIFDDCGCKFDITLKDVETVRGDADAIVAWADIVREEIDARYGL